MTKKSRSEVYANAHCHSVVRVHRDPLCYRDGKPAIEWEVSCGFSLMASYGGPGARSRAYAHARRLRAALKVSP